jgi:hypothetical protein
VTDSNHLKNTRFFTLFSKKKLQWFSWETLLFFAIAEGENQRVSFQLFDSSNITICFVANLLHSPNSLQFSEIGCHCHHFFSFLSAFFFFFFTKPISFLQDSALGLW